MHKIKKIGSDFNSKSFHKHKQTIKQQKITLKTHIGKIDFCPLRSRTTINFSIDLHTKLAIFLPQKLLPRQNSAETAFGNL